MTLTLSPTFFFFFFQAEDGIRDLYVTGVQTCALPISAAAAARPPAAPASAPAARQLEPAAAATSPAPRAAPAAALQAPAASLAPVIRSEERRVGKEWRSRGSRYH